MTLPMRPPSIYDVIGSDGETEEGGGGEVEGGGGDGEDTLTTSFYLPKDTTKVIHITRYRTISLPRELDLKLEIHWTKIRKRRQAKKKWSLLLTLL